jgi:hypothetical protein
MSSSSLFRSVPSPFRMGGPAAPAKHRVTTGAARANGQATVRAVRTNSRAAGSAVRTNSRAAGHALRANSRATGRALRANYRVTERAVRSGSSRAAERIAGSRSFRVAERAVHGHSRTSVIVVSAATTAVLGTAGFAVGAAPWAQAADRVTATVQVSHPASVKPGSFLFNSITGTSADGKVGGTSLRLDTLGLAAAAADTAPGHPAAQPPVAPAGQATLQVPAVRLPAAKPAVTKPVAAKAATAAKPKVTKPAAPASPYLIYDSVKPGSLPAGREVAVYATGGYTTSAASVAGHKVLWIDTQGYDPAADVLDVEPGDATPAVAGQWVSKRLTADPHAVAIVYTMRAEWDEVKNQMATLPGWMHTKVRYWIADPTGYAHVVPGAAATQWYWGKEYDITTATPGFEQ